MLYLFKTLPDRWGTRLAWKKPTDRVAMLGCYLRDTHTYDDPKFPDGRAAWGEKSTQDFLVEHMGSTEHLKPSLIHPPMSDTIWQSEMFLWTPGDARDHVYPPQIELLSYPTTPISGVRARGKAVVQEHIDKATKELRYALQRAMRVLMDHYRTKFGKDPAYMVTLVGEKPQMVDVDEAGKAVYRDGAVEWDVECSLGHLAFMNIRLIACDTKPNGFGEGRTEHPYLTSLSLAPTERKVHKGMDFNDIMAASYERKVVEFPDWWTAIHDRRKAGHRLYPCDDPKARQIGFGDHSRAETLMCGLVSVKNGLYDVHQGKITLPGVGDGGLKVEAFREAFKTNKGRHALLGA